MGPGTVHVELKRIVSFQQVVEYRVKTAGRESARPSRQEERVSSRADFILPALRRQTLYLSRETQWKEDEEVTKDHVNPVHPVEKKAEGG